jgi:hypothetical protein
MTTPTAHGVDRLAFHPEVGTTTPTTKNDSRDRRWMILVLVLVMAFLVVPLLFT